MTKKKYTRKEKIAYYEKRSKDKTLKESQRKFAISRLKFLKKPKAKLIKRNNQVKFKKPDYKSKAYREYLKKKFIPKGLDQSQRMEMLDYVDESIQEALENNIDPEYTMSDIIVVNGGLERLLGLPTNYKGEEIISERKNYERLDKLAKATFKRLNKKPKNKDYYNW